MSGKDLVAMDKGGGAIYFHCVEEMYITVEGKKASYVSMIPLGFVVVG
jgi:hypothetical protein